MVNPILKEIVELINETPLAIRSEVQLYERLPNETMQVIYSPGFVQRISETPEQYGICLNGGCYNMEENLVSKCLHIAYRNMANIEIDDLTKYFLRYDDVKYAARRRINERVKYMRG